MQLITIPTVTFDALAQPGDTSTITLGVNGFAQPAPLGGAAAVNVTGEPNDPVAGTLTIVQQVNVVAPEFTVAQVPGFDIQLGEPYRPQANYPDRWRVDATITKL